eukprot:2785920-Rhodomonas_salina.3
MLLFKQSRRRCVQPSRDRDHAAAVPTVTVTRTIAALIRRVSARSSPSHSPSTVRVSFKAACLASHAQSLGLRAAMRQQQHVSQTETAALLMRRPCPPPRPSHASAAQR